MRFLFVSNLYPPDSIGGYEQLCKEVAEAFTAQGHDVTVITSRQPGSEIEVVGGVTIHRVLHPEVAGGLFQSAMQWVRQKRRNEAENRSALRCIISETNPDSALIWGMWNIPRSVPATIESLLPDRTAYYFLDYWPSLPSATVQRMMEPSRRQIFGFPKKLVAMVWLPVLHRETPPRLIYRRPICVSRAVRNNLVDKGLPLQHASVVYLGISPETVRVRDMNRPVGNPVRLVYAGRLTPEKGIQTTIEALAEINRITDRKVTLDVFGSGDIEYETHLRQLSFRAGLGVQFRGRVSREQLADSLADFDILIFPSEWEEPFAHVVLEAMAAGLPVVGTTTGGTGEVLVDEVTGLTFKAGDVASLSSQVTRLIEDEELRRAIARAGYETVRNHFDFRQTVDQLFMLLTRKTAEQAAYAPVVPHPR